MRTMIAWLVPTGAFAVLALCIALDRHGRPGQESVLAGPIEPPAPAVEPLLGTVLMGRPPSTSARPVGSPPEQDRAPEQDQAPKQEAPELVLSRWRTAIVRGDPGAWEPAQREIRRNWDLYRDRVMELAAQDKDQVVRAANIRLVGTRSEPQAVLFVAERLQKDPSNLVQESCCRSLGRQAAAEHAGVVAGFVRDDSRRVSEAARDALARMAKDE